MLIPAERIFETDQLIAFFHPRPVYPTHILIVPRRAVADLLGLDPNDGALLGELLALVQKLIVDMDLDKSGYRIIINGGEYQEFPQLHFHLVSEVEQ